MPDNGTRLETQLSQGGIPTVAPLKPESQVQSLPPILCRLNRIPILNCSKAPWGLSVLSRVICIFTNTTISPGVPPRQRPSHYAIRAGQNLPGKEFRYLRTVIVTAAVYRGLSLLLRLRLQLPLTFRHRAGVSPYTSSFDFAETCVFGKQLLGPFHCGHLHGTPSR